MSKASEIKTRAEESFEFFMKLVNSHAVYGQVHEDMAFFLQRTEIATIIGGSGQQDKLVLLPRDHRKSHVVATWCAWWITNHPDTTILYTSGTEELAIAQLSAIKAILESPTYRRYWPEMVNEDSSKRAKWAMMDIDVDHPGRKAAGVRDHTVSARSVGGNTTGLHCDVLVMDDIVVPTNAYTEDGRQRVKAAYAQFTSVLSAGGFQVVVGTRYHGQDIYQMMLDMQDEIYSETGEITGTTPTYAVMQRVAETDGVFLWPRSQHPKSQKWFGFDNKILSRIRTKYFAAGERLQYYAQYYNSPDDPERQEKIGDKFQYYDPRHLVFAHGTWWYKQAALAIFAAADLAYTTRDTSDYTAFAVVGLDSSGFIYILELDQFKTDSYARYYATVLRLQEKWGFTRLRIEANTGGANLVVKYIQDQSREAGLALVVEGKAAVGEKTERCAAILEPRYEARTIWHYKGGYTTVYEEQMTMARPAHDDLRDAVAAAVEISRPASKRKSNQSGASKVVVLNNRFGGYR